MVFCDFFGVTEVFSVGDDGFLELRMVSGCGGIVRSCGGGLATRQAGNVLLGGAPGAGGLLLNTKASQEVACSRAPAAIVPGQEPEPHDAGVSRFSEIGSHLAEADAGESHAGWEDSLGMSGNAENGSHPAAADFSNEPGAVLWRHTPPHRTESGLLVYGMPSQDRAVQNQASCRTGHLRGAVWCDGRPQCSLRWRITSWHRID